MRQVSRNVVLSSAVTQVLRDPPRGLQSSRDLIDHHQKFFGVDFDPRRLRVDEAAGETDFAQQSPNLLVETFEQTKRALVHHSLRLVAGVRRGDGRRAVGRPSVGTGEPCGSRAPPAIEPAGITPIATTTGANKAPSSGDGRLVRLLSRASKPGQHHCMLADSAYAASGGDAIATRRRWPPR